MSFSVNFILGSDKDEATCIRQFTDVVRVPLVGEEVCIASTRDEDGNYILKARELPDVVIKGIVQKVSSSYDEWGFDSASRSSVQIVNVSISDQ